MPFHWYKHITSIKEGGCIGGQVHVPEGIWPPEFKFLFIDFIFLKIYSLQDRLHRACAECSPPLPPTRNETFYRSIRKDGSSYVNEGRLVEMWFGPYKDTQALYITKFGKGNHDTVIRIRYNGIVNKPPNPAIDFNYDGGATVEFDASGTSDPEGDELEYEWDFVSEGQSFS